MMANNFLFSGGFFSQGMNARNYYVRLCRPVCKKHGINQTAFDVLMCFANHSDPHSALNLCFQNGVKNSLVSMVLNELQAYGYLKKSEDSQTSQTCQLKLTNKATTIVKDGMAVQQRFTNTITNGISPEELVLFQKVSIRLSENLYWQ